MNLVDEFHDRGGEKPYVVRKSYYSELNNTLWGFFSEGELAQTGMFAFKVTTQEDRNSERITKLEKHFEQLQKFVILNTNNV